mmetsp:Transcript_7803/g.6902  ORF Transcript_7803/g.6902 Transcript_7803/m.6902 type:complete len:147 (+) Transcript_7803:207-647(+)
MGFSKSTLEFLILDNKYRYFKFDIELCDHVSIRLFHNFLEKVGDINQIEFIRISLEFDYEYTVDKYYELYNLAKETKNFPGIQIPKFSGSCLWHNEVARKREIYENVSQGNYLFHGHYNVRLIHNKDFIIDFVTSKINKSIIDFLK